MWKGGQLQDEGADQAGCLGCRTVDGHHCRRRIQGDRDLAEQGRQEAGLGRLQPDVARWSASPSRSQIWGGSPRPAAAAAGAAGRRRGSSPGPRPKVLPAGADPGPAGQPCDGGGELAALAAAGQERQKHGRGRNGGEGQEHPRAGEEREAGATRIGNTTAKTTADGWLGAGCRGQRGARRRSNLPAPPRALPRPASPGAEPEGHCGVTATDRGRRRNPGCLPSGRRRWFRCAAEVHDRDVSLRYVQAGVLTGERGIRDRNPAPPRPIRNRPRRNTTRVPAPGPPCTANNNVALSVRPVRRGSAGSLPTRRGTVPSTKFSTSTAPWTRGAVPTVMAATREPRTNSGPVPYTGRWRLQVSSRARVRHVGGQLDSRPPGVDRQAALCPECRRRECSGKSSGRPFPRARFPR